MKESMKLTFTGKMLLEDIEKKNTTLIVKFKSYLKEDFIEKALIVSLENNLVSKIFFSSNQYGTAAWVNGRGIYAAHRWETEDDLIQISTLARRYPTILEDGHVSKDFAREKIISDVLVSLLDRDLAENISGMVKNDSSKAEYDWETILKKNKEFTEKFIKNLIKAKKIAPALRGNSNLKSAPSVKVKAYKKENSNLNENNNKSEKEYKKESEIKSEIKGEIKNKKQDEKKSKLKSTLKKAESIAKKLKKSGRPKK